MLASKIVWFQLQNTNRPEFPRNKSDSFLFDD